MPIPLYVWAIGVMLVMLTAMIGVTWEDWQFHRTAGRADDTCPLCGRARGYRGDNRREDGTDGQ